MSNRKWPSDSRRRNCIFVVNIQQQFRLFVTLVTLLHYFTGRVIRKYYKCKWWLWFSVSVFSIISQKFSHQINNNNNNKSNNNDQKHWRMFNEPPLSFNMKLKRLKSFFPEALERFVSDGQWWSIITLCLTSNIIKWNNVITPQTSHDWGCWNHHSHKLNKPSLYRL